MPAHQSKLVAGAHRRGADAVILDLEDGVPESAKNAARDTLFQAVSQVGSSGAAVLVRINKPWRQAWRDLEAAAAANARAIVLPKVERAAQVRVFAEYLDELEQTDVETLVRLLAIIETAQGLQNVREIAGSSPRLCALIFGNEDLALELKIMPDPEHMRHLHAPLLLAAKAEGLLALGTIGSSANFQDLEAYRERVSFSRDWGFGGATCIHPDQVRVVNKVYRPSSARLAEAREVVAAFEAAGGEVISHEGRMVDRPIYLRARGLLDDEASL